MVPTGPETALIAAVVFAGGFVTGVTGFGYAIFATATLASVLDPQTAVVIVIIPILAANVSLVRELDRSGLRSCARRFWPFVAAAAAGTVVGMIGLASVSPAPLAAGLGLFTLAYVATEQPWLTVPGQAWLAEVCVGESRPKKAVLGLVSGAVFGATNAGVQVIAYLEAFDLDHSTFVGVVAMMFLGIGGVRVAVAWWLGLYDSTDLVVLSTLAAVPGLVGVVTGKRLRPRISPAQRDGAVYVLLSVIGAKLLGDGLVALA
ncbi:sulfite exporter TauE/SafE family protein [Halorientalis marina]|uniref:sulfite exporter TauE/SafE family protein n=1 Tax=Halorientalis marina TaxID=2931976 RepID=UPI001FF595A7|nr:sulfite exporter TauE/SafE family protein [Halorientalis marina]